MEPRTTLVILVEVDSPLMLQFESTPMISVQLESVIYVYQVIR